MSQKQIQSTQSQFLPSDDPTNNCVLQQNDGKKSKFRTIPKSSSTPLLNGLSVDVEDYFQVSNFSSFIRQDSWDSFPLRVEHNTDKLLELFHSHGVKATFFILGWIAERLPEIVRKIAAQGHEVACHGYQHQLIYDDGPERFREDVRRSKRLLEDIAGCQVYGYRAPSYSITNESIWALDILLEEGFHYDSSIFPVYHPRYGIPGAPRHHYVLTRESGQLEELPPATLPIGKFHLPIAGGGYFRLFPYLLTKFGLRCINHGGHSFVFYLHPWEIDPGQPRFRQASRLSRFRHYVNLASTKQKLRKLLKDFHFAPLLNLLEKNYKTSE